MPSVNNTQAEKTKHDVVTCLHPNNYPIITHLVAAQSEVIRTECFVVFTSVICIILVVIFTLGDYK